ncbi:MANBA [Branchiostoma lanceolatum]|uniref:Beta-mannosidase n=1 Tax=Branchiostoma lanceolatum TaxID=7740 RepID=A0A8J9Z309_BRALA|nr:MANBA [Branchiostoma lanceolatum]
MTTNMALKVRMFAVTAAKISLVFLIFPNLSYQDVGTIDLNGVWLASNGGGDINVNGTVPGCIHTDLMAAGKIGDPYFRFNDVEYRWIAKENWSYSRQFNVTETLLKHKEIVLVCEGLDTVATVTVNGHNVGQSNNMFRRYTFDIKSVLQSGVNTIQVTFQSAIKYAAEKNRSHVEYMVPPDCPPAVQKGECHPNFIRKEQCSFSWDWGPAFATQGIWKNISIQAYDSAVIRDVFVTPTKGDGKTTLWLIHVTVYMDVSKTSKTPVTGIVNAQLQGFPTLFVKNNVKLKSPSDQLTLTLNVSSQFKVESWWPAGYGKQMMYKVGVTFVSTDTGEVSAKLVKTGLRTVELVQETIKGSPGLSFYFKINNVPIFLKGSNWIPADAFKNRISTQYTRNLLQSAVDANMNTLRVWGGGIYEHDDVYDIADELGIMIWQDFMFACAMYPVDDDFLGNVREEIQQQVVRIGNHPAVIAWSGNNENEAALAANWYGTDNTTQLHTLYREDYVNLYVNVTMATVWSLDKSRPNITSSPSNGKQTEKENWVAKNPYDNHYGDVHYYNYKDDCWDWTKFPKTRFASEYGFQSWPSYNTLKKVSTADDWTLDSDFNDHRQHHQDGNTQMLDQAKFHFALPSGDDPVQQYVDNIYLSQVVQAMCIKTQTEFYRRSRSEIINGVGHTMGALYWQLNNIWQGPTWSSLEYGGRWKMLHYYAAKFFAPVMTVIFEDKEQLKVYVVSDLTTKLGGVTLQVQVWTWSSFKPLKSWTKVFDKEGNSANMIFNQTTADFLKDAKCTKREACFITSGLLDSKQKPYGPTNSYFLSPLKTASGLAKVNITVGKITILPDALKPGAANTLQVELKTTGPAPFVWLDSGDVEGRFSDNGFLMNVDTLIVQFYPLQSVKAQDLEKEVKVQSLMDIYRK